MFNMCQALDSLLVIQRERSVALLSRSSQSTAGDKT